jgi:hypothetical protein
MRAFRMTSLIAALGVLATILPKCAGQWRGAIACPTLPATGRTRR